MFEKVKAALGLGPSEPRVPDSEIRSGRLIPTPSAESLLPVTDAMNLDWDRQARLAARELSGMTTAEVDRRIPGLLTPEVLGSSAVLPGDTAERVQLLETAVRGRLSSEFNDHVRQVDALLTAPDDEVRDHLMLRDKDPVPGLDDPYARADFISVSMLDVKRHGQGEELHAQEMAALRRFGPTAADWQEHVAGEPEIQFLRAEGDFEAVEEARKRFFESDRVTDPTLQEIVERAMEVTDSRDPQDLRQDLSSGQIHLGPDRMDIAVEAASTAFVNQPVERAAFLALTMMEDYKDRHPGSEDAWNKEAKEILAEDPAFLERRYGAPVDKGSLVLHDVIVLEATARARHIHDEMHPVIDKGVETSLVIRNERPNEVAPPLKFDPAIMRGQDHGIA